MNPTTLADVDTVIINANILTLDRDCPHAQAIAFAAGRILALGTTQELSPLAGRAATVVDARGSTLLPGFIDSHSHLMFGGVVAQALDLTEAACLSDLLDMVRSRAQSTPEGAWIRGYGVAAGRLKEKRYPTRQELDQVSGGRPVWLAEDSFHASLVNSKAFQMLEIPLSTPGVELAADGSPTGAFLNDAANVPARQRVFGFISDDEARQMLQHVTQLGATRGVTTVHAFEGSRMSADRDIELLMRFRHELPIHVVPYYETFDVERAMQLGVSGVGGCGRNCLDGMPNIQTAAMVDPYCCSEERGSLFQESIKLHNFVIAAFERGMQVGMHAMGDAAIEQLLATYERAIEETGRTDLRPRIEHFHVPSRDHVRRAADLGVGLAVQPIFTHLWGGRDGIFFERLGERRYKRIDTYREILDSGAIASCGADLPVHPADPLRWIQLLVDNQIDQDQSVSMIEAIRMCTYNGAWLGFQESETGTLAVSKAADAVMLGRDPHQCMPHEIAAIPILKTYVGGKLVFESSRP
ncbi:amidohydrolase [Bordetella bronchiseptica]|uniref:amidohydrolase n=1 Tax=Bordetella bronchiseptica TaxID=518 RepID=UPI0005293529|nr:amidohydrolase [Bordetella bronchiseptica]VEF41451.1 N-substituted formamide deformylase precursor [Bordetella bronchiseptica]